MVTVVCGRRGRQWRYIAASSRRASQLAFDWRLPSYSYYKNLLILRSTRWSGQCKTMRGTLITSACHLSIKIITPIETTVQISRSSRFIQRPRERQTVESEFWEQASMESRCIPAVSWSKWIVLCAPVLRYSATQYRLRIHFVILQSRMIFFSAIVSSCKLQGCLSLCLAWWFARSYTYSGL